MYGSSYGSSYRCFISVKTMHNLWILQGVPRNAFSHTGMSSRQSLQQSSAGKGAYAAVSNKMRASIALAALAGLALRVFFVLKFPVTDSGDAPFYIQLAWNWLKNRVYGFPINGVLTPVDMRTPGYPAFLAAIFAFAGNSQRAVMLVQAVVDVATCFIIALIAARLAPSQHRQRVAIAALWLAALCPFTANYTAVVLTETLTIFLTALAILVLLQTEIGPGASDALCRAKFLRESLAAGRNCGWTRNSRAARNASDLAFGRTGAGRQAGWRPRDWGKLFRAGALMGIGLILPLAPWAARNWRVLHEVRFLAPRYSELPGEYTPHGFIDWTNTWLWRFRDVYLTHWKLNEEEIPSIRFLRTRSIHRKSGTA